MSDTFMVRILSPHEVVWEGAVASLQSRNSEGDFSIYPDHARFMTIITQEDITVVLSDSTAKTFTFPAAVLYFEGVMAKIYTQPAIRGIGA